MITKLFTFAVLAAVGVSALAVADQQLNRSKGPAGPRALAAFVWLTVSAICLLNMVAIAVGR